MAQVTEIKHREHLIQASVFFDSDIRQWHVGCVITRPEREPGSRMACKKPMYLGNEEEAIQASLEYGKRIVDSGLVWD